MTLRPISNPGARVAALLAGDVDVIETPPIQDFDAIRQAGFEIDQGLSNRVIYLHLDNGEEVPPGVSGTNGVNPFADVRVREAISKAINRDAIVDRVMGGVAVTAGELLPYPLFGTSQMLSRMCTIRIVRESFLRRPALLTVSRFSSRRRMIATSTMSVSPRLWLSSCRALAFVPTSMR